MKLNNVDLLNVYLKWQEDIFVGRLALKNRKIFFEYESSFLELNIPLSPFMLPLKAGVQVCEDQTFSGLFGVFNDSLPDGWGRLLLDRQVEKHGVHRNELSPLDRLAHIGDSAMGALRYKPVLSSYKKTYSGLDLDRLFKECQTVLEGEQEEVFEELLFLNGSSAGARPKIMVGVNQDKKKIIHGTDELSVEYSHWMIKFASHTDPKDMGAIEYAYSLMAKDAGIDISDTYLFETTSGGRYFGIKRFDRKNHQPIHMHSLCGLIHADHRTPTLDYEMLLKVTLTLTKNIQEVEKAFRLACFNVFAHNRDDHSKNFSFLLEEGGEWKLSPAYDLTFSYGPAYEQSTLVMGEGKNPGTKHLLKLAKKFDIHHAKEIIDQVADVVSCWSQYAQNIGMREKSITNIAKSLSRNI